MKKVALTLASVLAAATFAQEASAVPAFARQTGMACSACHQQHFPVLNGFGQAFKAAGFTMMGAQEKVEGEHLSIPAVLNSAVLLKARYQKTDGKDKTGTINSTSKNDGIWNLPDEMSLFFGGRIADADNLKIGFVSENSFTGNGGGGIITGLKLPIVYDLGDVKATVVVFATDGQGAAYGFDFSSAGMVRGIRWAEHGADISAMGALGTQTAASGLAFGVKHDMGYVGLTRYSPNLGLGNGNVLGANFLRAAVTPNVAGWAIQTGVGIASGKSDVGGVDAALQDLKYTALDFQAHGEVAGMETGVYASYATVPRSTTASPNQVSGANLAKDQKAMAVGVDVSVIPHTLHIGGAFMSKNDGGQSLANGANADVADGKVNSITLTAIYDLTMNVAIHFDQSFRSGSSFKAGRVNDATAQPDGSQGAKNLTTFLLEAAW